MHLSEGYGVGAGTGLCFAALLFFLFTILQFRRKGPVLDPVCLMLDREERERLRTPKAYRAAAYLYLVCTLLCLLAGLAFLFDSHILAMAAATLAVTAALGVILRWVAQTGPKDKTA